MRYSSVIRIGLLLAVGAAPAALSAQTPTFASPPKAIPSSIPTGYAAAVSLVGNFNGNGNTDAIVSVGNPATGAASIEFLSGNGAGSFTQTGTVTLPTMFNQILVADVNGDGKDDIITLMGGCEELPCNNWPNNDGNGDGVFTVLLSQGNGKFTQSDLDTLPSGLAGVQGVIGDFNKDGKPDVAVLSYSGTGINATELTIFLNQGNGTFTQTVYQTPAVLSPPDGIGTTNLVVGDFEGNGNLDLAFGFIASHFGVPGPVQIMTFAGDGKGDFGPGVIAYTLNSYSFSVNQTSLFAADVNGDDRTDLAINLHTKGPGFAFITLLANTSGKFTWGSAVNYGAPYNSVAFTDVNGDGHPDFVFVSSKTNSSGTSTTDYGGIYLGTASGGFHTPHIALSVPGNGSEPQIITAPLKTGALSSLFVNDAKAVGLEYINTTK